MNYTLGALASPIPITKKASARVALVDIKDPANYILSECFRQFGMETVSMNAQSVERLKHEKYEACVINLEPNSEPVVATARTSPSNQRMVIYGVGGSAQAAMRFSRYGINA